jgi:3-deoxy-D-manno-octulosonate 8-phosphate phosphatase (KDO 8-P phosphatase)
VWCAQQQRPDARKGDLMKAQLQHPPELLLKAQGIAVVFFDVDGVLTDGGLYLSARGETLKRFHVLDGHGFRMLQEAGLIAVVITGRDSKPLRARLQALGIVHARFGVKDKPAAASGAGGTGAGPGTRRRHR